MGRFTTWLGGVADRIPRWLLRLGVLWLVVALFGSALGFGDLVEPVTNFLLCSMAVLAFVALIGWTLRHEPEPEAAPLTLVRPGPPGRRTWKHNIYDDNPYAVLGVPQDAAPAQVRAAFRRLTQQYHPDAAPAEEKERAALIFVNLDHAYELLTDPEMRARYDAWLEYTWAQEPPLEEAVALLRTADGRAWFDREIGYRPRPVAPAGNPARPAPPAAAAALPAETPAAAAEPPPEVEIPDAVREALGLPPPRKRPPAAEASDPHRPGLS